MEHLLAEKHFTKTLLKIQRTANNGGIKGSNWENVLHKQGVC
jgi:hypothetical protein